MAQSEYFEEHIAPIQHLIVLECPDEILVQRLGHRDRFDDAPENVLRRIHTFRDVTSRVVEHFELMQKVARINSNQDLDKVRSEVRKTLTSVVGLRALPHTIHHH
jgi:adenylate kinase family enzyme